MFKLNKTETKVMKELASGNRRSYDSGEGRRIGNAIVALRDKYGLVETFANGSGYHWRRRGLGKTSYWSRERDWHMRVKLTERGEKIVAHNKAKGR